MCFPYILHLKERPTKSKIYLKENHYTLAKLSEKPFLQTQMGSSWGMTSKGNPDSTRINIFAHTSQQSKIHSDNHVI